MREMDVLKQQTADLSRQNKETQKKVSDLSQHNKEAQKYIMELSKQNRALQKCISDLSRQNWEMQKGISALTRSASWSVYKLGSAEERYAYSLGLSSERFSEAFYYQALREDHTLDSFSETSQWLKRYRNAKQRIAFCAFEDFHFTALENDIRTCNLEQNYIIAYVNQNAKEEVSLMLGEKSALVEWHSYADPDLPFLQSSESTEEDLRRQFVQHVKDRRDLDFVIIPSPEYHPNWYLPLAEGERHYELIAGVHNINSIFFSDRTPEETKRLFAAADSYCVFGSELKKTMLSGGITHKKIYVFEQHYDAAEHPRKPKSTDRIVFVITGSVEEKRKDYQTVVDALAMVPDIHPRIRLILLGKAVTEYARGIVSQLDSMKKTGLETVSFSSHVPADAFEESMSGADYLLGPTKVETTYQGVPETYGITKQSGIIREIIGYAKPVVLICDMIIPSNIESSVIRYSSATELAEVFRTLTGKTIAEKYAEKARANSEHYALENLLWDRQ